MSQSPSQQQPSLIDHVQDNAVNIVYNLCSIVTMPVELALRPWHGTRFFPPIVMFCSAVMMALVPLFFSVAGAVGNMIPFVRVPVSFGLIGMDGLCRLFFLGSLIHGIRKWNLMLHMEREVNSIYEGPPLFFFTWIPKATFWNVRIIYEPIFLAGLSMVLANFFVLEPGAANFILISAIFLAMKNFTGWYMQWQFIRELMDLRNAAPIIAAMSENRETEDELATIHLASFPKDLDPEMRKTVISGLEQRFSNDSK